MFRRQPILPQVSQAAVKPDAYMKLTQWCREVARAGPNTLATASPTSHSAMPAAASPLGDGDTEG